MAADLTDKDYERLCALVYAKSGIHLHQGKKNLMRARLGKRLRATGSPDYDQYYRFLVHQDDGAELAAMVDAISTNKTSFFRESNHFEFLESEVFPELARTSGRLVKLRVWSAGCSSGEEPYSVAMSILEFFRATGQSLDVKILSTDISTRMLAAGRKGVYEEGRVTEMPFTIQRRYFKRGVGKNEGYYRIKDRVRRMVVFRKQNLMERFSFREPLHMVFCRNVMIYFDKKTQASLIQRLYECLAPGGYLFVGHSESLSSVDHQFAYLQPSIYQKQQSILPE